MKATAVHRRVASSPFLPLMTSTMSSGPGLSDGIAQLRSASAPRRSCISVVVVTAQPLPTPETRNSGALSEANLVGQPEGQVRGMNHSPPAQGHGATFDWGKPRGIGWNVIGVAGSEARSEDPGAAPPCDREITEAGTARQR